MNIFERATRKKLRFDTPRGQLSVEALFDLPLVTPRSTQLDLDTVARSVAASLRELTEDSFVQSTPDPRRTTLQLKLDILKYIIASKQADAAAAEKRAEKAQLKSKLTDILAQKRDASLSEMSEAEILRKLEELS